MGKPFFQELQQLRSTYTWALGIPIDELKEFVNSSTQDPLLAIASGGSLTAAHLVTLLHQKHGTISKAITPLEFIESHRSIRSANAIIISAGGRNADILTSMRVAAINELNNVLALCMKSESPLKDLATSFHYSTYVGFDLPCGKDGFLATNSLVALIIVLIRAYLGEGCLPSEIPVSWVTPNGFTNTVHSLFNSSTLQFLYSGWGLPAAVDAESKFVEAALCNVHLSDYRNFGHGRHHWLAKRSQDTGVVALITPNENDIATRTLRLIPEDIPIVTLTTSYTGAVGSLHMLFQVMNLVHEFGLHHKSDPGRPHVPEFGRRLYNLKLSTKNLFMKEYGKIHFESAVPILRKTKYAAITDMPKKLLDTWLNSYGRYIHELESTTFGSIVLDFDGTICDSSERFSGVSEPIQSQLLRMLKEDAIIGIATGRGKSVRLNMQKIIPQRFWDRIIIGYYNGSVIASLSENDYPNLSVAVDPALQELERLLRDRNAYHELFKYNVRPTQITIDGRRDMPQREIINIVRDMIARISLPGVKVVESSHSVDVLAPGVSKLDLLRYCQSLARKYNRPQPALCIGDRGQWPGNDHELLGTPYSLSVNTVSSDPTSCWNISPAGYRGVQATLLHLNRVNFSNGTMRYRNN